MSNCTRMNRPCSCSRLVTYDRQGRVPEQNNAVGCLSDEEMRWMLMILLTEWRQRLDGHPAQTYDARH